jgi:tetratricopeptide (TPR) repeat protein
MSDPLPSLAREAQEAYEAGNFDAAISKQKQLIAETTRFNRSRVHDYLALAMFLFESGAFGESLDSLQKAAAIWPANTEVAENAGVLLLRLDRCEEAKVEFERAMALGSESLNVLDGLCHCLGRLKDFSAVQRYGRRVLEAKNKASLAVGTKYPLPLRAPPVFEATRRQENVISYCLWGNDPRYIVPLLENLKLGPHLFPAWTIRIYFDKSVPDDVLGSLRKGGAHLVDKSSEHDGHFYSRLLWRFEVANDSAVRRFLVRDADSLLTVKERVAVDAWLASDTYFHIMRDFFTHTDLTLAGMWGGVANVLPDLKKLWHAYRSPKMQGRTADQRFLSDIVWPTLSQSCLLHDSVFTGCLGSVSFPPYGELLPGRHIGQSALRFFRRD